MATAYSTSREVTARPLYASRLPFDERRVGAAAVYCSDGRFGEQMDEFLHEQLRLPRYDRLAVPGGAACLAGHALFHYERAALERQLRFLVDAHGLRRVVLIAHQDCAFYRDLWLGGRTLADQQAIDLENAADQIRSWCPGIAVEAYYARKVDGQIALDLWRCRSGLNVT